jgi:hypothetical protein
MASNSNDLVVRIKTNSTEFNEGIEKAKGKVKDFKREGQGAGDGLANGMAAAKKAIGKIAIAIGAATAAWKTYKSMAEQTQTWGDELNNTISACKTTFQGLQREIIMGGNLAVGQLKKMYDEAYKLSQLKDQLGTLKISQKWNRGTYVTDYNEARADYAEAKQNKDEEGMRKAYQAMMKALNGYANESRGLIESTKENVRQQLISNKIDVKDGEDIYNVMNEVKDAQEGHLMGITQTLKELSKKTTTTMYSPTAGAVSVESGGLEWGKARMKNLGYSDAQIAAAERQLRMAELNDANYNEAVDTLLEGKNVLNEINSMRKSAARLVKPETEVTANTTTIVTDKAEVEAHGQSDLVPQLQPKKFEGEIQFTPNAAQPLDEDWVNNELAQYEYEQSIIAEAKETEAALWKERIDNLNAYASALGHVSQMFQNLGSMASDESPWKKLMNILGSVASGVMQLVQTYTSLVAVEAVAQAIESGKGIPFPYNLVAMASAGAVITSLIATIAAQANSQHFAQGGIVGGNDYHDGIRANLSTGEMVLNKNQQTRLWSLIQSGGNGQKVENVVFKISGEDLVGVIDNYNKNSNY